MNQTELIRNLRNGDVRAVARLLTLIEDEDEKAEEILKELRECPPAPGFERVEVPGERERDYRTASNGIISIPESTWQQILTLRDSLQG